MDRIERLPITDFTEALHNEAIERITRFSVGITGIDLREQREVAYQSGSGTLVDIDGTLCILTADHVIADVLHRDRVSLLIDWHGGLRRCIFEESHLRYVRLPRGPSPELGPDLGVIVLPPSGEGVSTLRANKVFYDLSKRIDRFAGAYLVLSEGVWIPCGVLGEGSQVLPAIRGFAAVLGHRGMMGIATTPKETLRDGFDYLELSGGHGVDSDMPETFGGTSGGGLWQVRISRSADGRLKLREVVLSGVIFYETDVVNGVRGLRSHGRASIHERLVGAVRQAARQFATAATG